MYLFFWAYIGLNAVLGYHSAVGINQPTIPLSLIMIIHKQYGVYFVHHRRDLNPGPRPWSKVSDCSAMIPVMNDPPSSRYNSLDRQWLFALSDHEELIRKLRPLRPEVDVEPLPRMVINVLQKNRNVKRKEVFVNSDQGITSSIYNNHLNTEHLNTG